jgi:hypothetical protein
LFFGRARRLAAGRVDVKSQGGRAEQEGVESTLRMGELALNMGAPAARRRARVEEAFTAPGLSGEERARVIRRLQLLARFLDDCLLIPGTNVRFGFDGIIGLAPGIGDAISIGLSAYIVFEARRLGASNATLAKMVASVALDALVGLVPVLGDVADFALKANRRNLRLLGIEPLGSPVSA